MRLVSAGAADLECVCFGTATEILIGPWQTQIILFTFWGDGSHFGLLRVNIEKGICRGQLDFFDGMSFEVLGQNILSYYMDETSSRPAGGSNGLHPHFCQCSQ